MNAVLLERDRFVDAPVQERRFLFFISIYAFASIEEDALIRGNTRSFFVYARFYELSWRCTLHEACSSH